MNRDGNCLFRALSYIITGRQVYHAQVRNKSINHMRSIENVLVPHINTTLKCYLHKTGVAQSGFWGTDIEILAASSLLPLTYLFTPNLERLINGKSFQEQCLVAKNLKITVQYI